MAVLGEGGGDYICQQNQTLRRQETLFCHLLVGTFQPLCHVWLLFTCDWHAARVHAITAKYI